MEVIPYRPNRWWPVQFVLLVWRWVFELALISVCTVFVVQVHRVTAWPWRMCLLLLVVAPVVLMLNPTGREGLRELFWCQVTRHRLRGFFVQTRAHNRSLRLPWILWVWPTPVGERAWVWLVSGLSIEDFASSTERLAASSWARSARVERSRRWASLVRVDIVRTDPLTAASGPLASVLIPDGSIDLGQRLDMPVTGFSVTDLPDPRGEAKAGQSSTGASNGSGRARKSAISERDGNGIVSSPYVVRGGGEDVSDYV